MSSSMSSNPEAARGGCATGAGAGRWAGAAMVRGGGAGGGGGARGGPPPPPRPPAANHPPANAQHLQLVSTDPIALLFHSTLATPLAFAQAPFLVHLRAL